MLAPRWYFWLVYAVVSSGLLLLVLRVWISEDNRVFIAHDVADVTFHLQLPAAAALAATTATSTGSDVNTKFVDSFAHHYNVCIHPSDNQRFNDVPTHRNVLRLYDNSPRSNFSYETQLVYKLGTDTPNGTNSWVLIREKKKIPRDWPIQRDVAFFTPYWKDASKTRFPERAMPLLQAQMHYAKTQTPLRDRAFTSRLIVPTLKWMTSETQNGITSVGYSQINDFEAIVHENKPRCFRHVIFGSSLSGQRKTVTQLHLYHNVCLEYDPMSRLRPLPFIAHLQVYDRTVPANTTPVHVPIPLRVKDNTNFWIAHFRGDAPLPQNATLRNAVAHFVPYWRDSRNIYILFECTAPHLYNQITWSGNLTRTVRGVKRRRKAAGSRTLIVPNLRVMPNNFRHVIKSLGIKYLRQMSALVSSRNPICFRHAVLGHGAIQDYIEPITSLMSGAFHIERRCNDSKTVLILQRTKSRHILNVKDIESAFRSQGHTQIITKSFEGKPISKQMALVQCASVFVGVQGAGLAWYRFLPRNATLIELYYNGWKSKYVARAKKVRPDIRAAKFYCDAVTPAKTWRRYAAKWYDSHSRVVSHSMKLKLIAHSDTVNPVRGNIWKDSDVTCNVTALNDVLR